MDHLIPHEGENEDMEVDHQHQSGGDQSFIQEIHPLASFQVVNENGEYLVQPIPLSATNQVPLPMLTSQHDEAAVEVLRNIGRLSPTSMTSSSRGPSPIAFDEESNQSSKQSYQKGPVVDNDHEDGSMCPICMDNWTNTGEHRICALKCGHLFGYKCVNRWLTSQNRKTCPTCKKRVGKGDLRYIYAKKLTAVDTSELEIVKKQLDFVIEERNRAQADLAKYACREHQLKQEIQNLKLHLNSVLSRHLPMMTHLNANSNKVQSIHFSMDKSMEICKFGQNRVFDANCHLDLLMASMKSPSHLFEGFGLKKLNISTYRSVAFIPIHSLQIRDICFHPVNNWVLTASMDKTFKVTDNVSNTVTHQFGHTMPLWSCCWDLNNNYVLYTGTQNGQLVKYDIRHLNEPVSTLVIEGDMSPVVSVASLPAVPDNQLAQGGVISCKLNSLWLYENDQSNVKRHNLSLEGPFISMKYQANIKQLLVSSRPNNRVTYSRHTLCTLEKTQSDTINCNILHTFQGGGMQKLLSKSCFLSATGDFIAAHQEDSKSVFLWSINTGEKVCSIPSHNSVLDLKGIQNNNGSYLISLTEKRLDFFKFI